MTLSAASATVPIASATTLAARRTAATSAGFPATPVEFPAEFPIEFPAEFPAEFAVEFAVEFAAVPPARVAPAHADAVTSARTPTSHTAWNTDGTAPFDAARITVAARWSSSSRPSPAAESPTSASAAAPHAFAVASANAAILAIAASSSSGVA